MGSVLPGGVYKVVVDMVMPIRFLQRPLEGYSLPIQVAPKSNSWAQGSVRDHPDSYLVAFWTALIGGQFASLSELM